MKGEYRASWVDPMVDIYWKFMYYIYFTAIYILFCDVLCCGIPI